MDESKFSDFLLAFWLTYNISGKIYENSYFYKNNYIN